MAEEVKVTLPQWLGAILGGAYWQLGLGFMGWQTVAAPMRKGILEPLDRALTATYRYDQPTAAQLGTLYERGIITLKDFITGLKNLGYDDTAIAVITHYYTLRVYDDLVDYHVDKLKEEKEILEEALYIKLNPKKKPEKKLLYRTDEIVAISKWSVDKIIERMKAIDKRIEELKYGLAADLWDRLSRDLPKIKIEWYGIKELLKKRPEEIPAVKVPVPKVPVAAPPEVVPTVPPTPPAKKEWVVKPLTKEVVPVLNEWIKKRYIPKAFFKYILELMTRHLRDGKWWKTKKLYARYDGKKRLWYVTLRE